MPPQRSNKVEPFDPEVRQEFIQWLHNHKEHSNRYRMHPTRLAEVKRYIINPQLPATSLEEQNLKTCAKNFSFARDGRLIRPAEPPRHPTDREYVPEEKVFEVIWGIHCQLGHAGKNKTYPVINSRYYGITRDETMWVLRRCHICAPHRPLAKKTTQCGCVVRHMRPRMSAGHTPADRVAPQPILETRREASTDYHHDTFHASENESQIPQWTVINAPQVPQVNMKLQPDSISGISETSPPDPPSPVQQEATGAVLPTPEAQYPCGVCGKMYTSMPKLIWHRKIHGKTSEVVEWKGL